MSYSFGTYSGGTLFFDHAVCLQCETKACISSCNPRGAGSILELQEGKPFLKISPQEAQRGHCSECLGCEEACQLEGKAGLRIDLSMPGLDRWLESLMEKGIRPIYLRAD